MKLYFKKVTMLTLWEISYACGFNSTIYFSRRESDFCIEFSTNGRELRQMRIFRIFKVTDSIAFGIYACSPTVGSYKATFTNMIVNECQWEYDVDWKQ